MADEGLLRSTDPGLLCVVAGCERGPFFVGCSLGLAATSRTKAVPNRDLLACDLSRFPHRIYTYAAPPQEPVFDTLEPWSRIEVSCLRLRVLLSERQRDKDP